MHRQVSKLILYRDLGEDSILRNLARIFQTFESCHYREEELVTDIYRQMKKLLDLGTDYGFDKNLWHNYLTYVLVTNENSFSITCEKHGAHDGTVNHFAKNDFRHFMNLFHYDFRMIEEALGIDCFSTILNYRAISKQERMYNKNVSEKVRALSDVLAAAENVEDFFKVMGTTLEAEMARYDAVLHLSPPTNPAFYQSTHVRTESLDEAFKIDEKILKIWEGHPNRLIVEGKEHFFEKAEIIKNFVEKIIKG